MTRSALASSPAYLSQETLTINLSIVLKLMYLHRLADWPTVRLADWPTVRLSDCQTGRQADWQTGRLADC